MQRRLWLNLLLIAVSHGCGHGQQLASPNPRTGADHVTVPNARLALISTLPGITIDRQADVVDLEAKIARRYGDWLELVACTPNSREHESIVTVSAKPSHIYQALLMLGLEPGHPLNWKPNNKGSYDVEPASGPPVRVYFIIEEDGRRRQIPANAWVVNQRTGQPLVDNRWLFTGSRFATFDQTEIFLADLNGTVISLVNFGDDLLARQTRLTDKDDGQVWNVRAEAVPEAGTPLTVRLRPVRAAGQASNEVHD